MNENNTNEARVLGGQIAEYIRLSRAARNDINPLPMPDAMTNSNATPAEKSAAEEAYGEALLLRRSLSETEQRWLQSQISLHLRGK